LSDRLKNAGHENDGSQSVLTLKILDVIAEKCYFIGRPIYAVEQAT